MVIEKKIIIEMRTNKKRNGGKPKHAKAKFKVVEKSLKIICIIMMHSFYIKLFFFPNPGPCLCFHVKMKYISDVGIAALFHLWLKHWIHQMWTPTLERFSFTLYLQIFTFDLAQLLKTGSTSCWAVLYTTFKTFIYSFKILILLVSQAASAGPVSSANSPISN